VLFRGDVRRRRAVALFARLVLLTLVLLALCLPLGFPDLLLVDESGLQQLITQ
jgi:hypothetical protein